jgi:hypothetical protein
MHRSGTGRSKHTASCRIRSGSRAMLRVLRTPCHLRRIPPEGARNRFAVRAGTGGESSSHPVNHRLNKLIPEQRSEIARKAGKAGGHGLSLSSRHTITNLAVRTGEIRRVADDSPLWMAAKHSDHCDAAIPEPRDSSRNRLHVRPESPLLPGKLRFLQRHARPQFLRRSASKQFQCSLPRAG